MVVQHNMAAANTNRMLGSIVTQQSKSTEKLSSGYRINRAGDDAAGLAISEKMRGQIRGLNQASSNAQDGISLIQTAEGALTETHSILQRMRELAVQAASDTNTDDDRTQLQNEIDQLTSEVDRIANTTEFNTKKLLDGSQKGAVNQKDGTLKVEGDFANSNVSVNISLDGSERAAFSDVIRIEITKDFAKEQSTKDIPKISNEMIEKINSLITTADAIQLDNVLQDTTPVEIENTAYNSDGAFIENLKGAISATKSGLSALETTASTTSAARNSNIDAVNTTVDNIMSLVEKTQADNGETILNSSVTKEDLRNALNNYINAIAADGTAAGEGASNDIVNTRAEFVNLFNSSTAVSKGAATAPDLFAAYKDSSNTDVAAVNADDVEAGVKQLSEIVTNITDSLDDFAKGIASVMIDDDVAQAKVEQVKDVLSTLEDTDLSKAVVDYMKAKDDLDNLADPTDAQKAEYQEKVDAAKANLDKLNVSGSVLSVRDLFGNTDDTTAFKIDAKVDKNNDLSIKLKNKSGDDTIVTISNADKLKAGDTIILTSQEMVESKQAAVGKEALRLQIGANAGQEVALGIKSMKANDLNIVQTKEGKEGQALNVKNQADASLAVNAYDQAIKLVSTERAKMGAIQNRLEHTISNLDTSSENLQTAESRIRDVDMASEMVNYSKNNILQQAAQSMLAQANQANQGVLSLLR